MFSAQPGQCSDLAALSGPWLLLLLLDDQKILVFACTGHPGFHRFCSLGSLQFSWSTPRVVAKISSCRVSAISRRGTEQQGSSFGSIFLLFPMKVAGAHANSSQGKSLALGSWWQPWHTHAPTIQPCIRLPMHQSTKSLYKKLHHV